MAVILAAVGYFTSLFSLSLDRIGETLVLVGAIWAAAFVNLAGPKLVARLSAATLLLGLAPTIAAIAIALALFDVELFQQSWNVSGAPIGEAAAPLVLTIFWAFLGLESASALANSVRAPNKTLPVAAVGGTLIAAVIYALAATALFGFIPAAQLAQSSAPFADAIGLVVGPIAGAIIAAAAFARTFGCGAGWFLISAEMNQQALKSPHAPSLLRRWGDNRAANVLIVAILMTAVAASTISPSLNEQFVYIVDISVLMFLAIYAGSCCALLAFTARSSAPGKAGRYALGSLGVFCVLSVIAGYFVN